METDNFIITAAAVATPVSAVQVRYVNIPSPGSGSGRPSSSKSQELAPPAAASHPPVTEIHQHSWAQFPTRVQASW